MIQFGNRRVALNMQTEQLHMSPIGKAQRSAPSKTRSSSKKMAAGPQAARMNELIEQIAEGSTEAFHELFEYYAPRIKAYLIRLGAEAGTADELAQEAMLNVWRKAVQFDRKKASAGTWIFTIARNLRIDAIRREKRPELDPEDPALVPDNDPAPDAEVQRGEEAVLVREAISKLSADQAEVVRLSFFEDLSHSAIAERLDIPLGTVKSRLRLACGRIRGLLDTTL